MLKHLTTLQKTFLQSGLIVFVGLLTACGSSGTGESTNTLSEQNNSDENITPLIEYNRSSLPAPIGDEQQAFMSQLWNNVADDSRCGGCHNQNQNQSPLFARSDNINLAYDAALPYVNLENPSDSILVSQVASGHQCWTASNDDCAASMTRWITAWATETIGAPETTIQLSAPVSREVNETKILPADAPEEFAALHNLLTTYCDGCHAETADTAQKPFFATADEETAYDAIRVERKIDLGDGVRDLIDAQSRIVVQLKSQAHNCWSADCQTDADRLLTAIKAIATTIPEIEVDPALIISKGLQLKADGLPASSGGRHESALIALWEFKEGEGYITRDNSGIEPPMDLTLVGDFSWVGGWGIMLEGGRAFADSTASNKLHSRIAEESGEYSIEAWIAPNNVTQEGPARIISYSANNDERNFMLGQTQYNYDFLHRSENTNDNGEPALSTEDAAERLQATLQHVVVTYDPQTGRRIYVNGEFTDDVDPAPSTSISSWKNNFQFILGNETSQDFPWFGTLRMVAIHNRALNQEQITQNFDVGVGQKYFLLFNVTELVGIDDCWDSFVVFETAQFDSYSYLFNAPYFARLYTQQTPGDGIPAACTAETAPEPQAFNFNITDMRIGMNGAVVGTGQAYQTLTIDVSEDLQPLSSVGTIIPLQNGPDSDQFFLAFGNVADQTGAYTDPEKLEITNTATGVTFDDIGLRTFEEITASLSTMTEIPASNANTFALFEQIKQQLPVTESIRSFTSAHQMGVAQLAMVYCSELVNDTALRTTYFPGFNFNNNPTTAFGTAASRAQRDLIYAPLVAKMTNNSLTTAPNTTELSSVLDDLLDGVPGRTGLTDCSGTCDAVRTQNIVKALCATTAGSAIMLLQ